MRTLRVLAVASLLALPLLACETLGFAPKAAPPTPSASTSQDPAGGAPSMDDTADDGSCAAANCVRRCDKKERPLDCTEAGLAYRKGDEDFPKDLDRAVTYLQKACGLKSREACRALAQLLWSGEGTIAADPARAKVLFDDACEQGSGAACDEIARKLEADPKKKDHAKAIEYWGSGCAAESFEQAACDALAEAAGSKDKDATRIVEGWMERCKLKHAPSCNAIQRLKKK